MLYNELASAKGFNHQDGLFAFHSPDPELEDSSNSLGETVARLRLACVTEEAAGKYECRATSGKHQVEQQCENILIDILQILAKLN